MKWGTEQYLTEKLLANPKCWGVMITCNSFYTLYENSSTRLIEQKIGTADCFKNEDSVPLSGGHQLKKFKQGTKKPAGAAVFVSFQAANWGCGLH